jgi:hypothetical protein
VDVRHLASAHPEWRAVFDDESLVRVAAWAVLVEEGEQRVVGIIVDPNDPSRLIPAPDAVTPEGSTFVRYARRT